MAFTGTPQVADAVDQLILAGHHGHFLVLDHRLPARTANERQVTGWMASDASSPRCHFLASRKDVDAEGGGITRCRLHCSDRNIVRVQMYSASARDDISDRPLPSAS